MPIEAVMSTPLKRVEQQKTTATPDPTYKAPSTAAQLMESHLGQNLDVKA